MKSGRDFIILSVYLDDIILAANNLNMIQRTMLRLNSKFEMKDIGEAWYVLGIKITKYRRFKNIYLSQERLTYPYTI